MLIDPFMDADDMERIKVARIESNMNRELDNFRYTLLGAVLYTLVILVLGYFGVIKVQGHTVSFYFLFIHNGFLYANAIKSYRKYKKLFYELVMESI
jgi:hypothetical protein